MNRHGAYRAVEIMRVLKSGGVFITEQVGGRNNMLLSTRLLPDYAPLYPAHDLAHERARFEAAGFELLETKEYFPNVRFFDIGALVYFARIIQSGITPALGRGCLPRGTAFSAARDPGARRGEKPRAPLPHRRPQTEKTEASRTCIEIAQCVII